MCVDVEIKCFQLIVYYSESVSNSLHMSTEVAGSPFLLNSVHFILSTSGGSHCVIIDIKLYEVFLWSVDAVQCSQKCRMSLADKLTFFMKREIFIPTMCTHQHMLAWNLCCKFTCFIFYHIRYNWYLSFSFHAYIVNSMFFFLKVTVLGSTETLPFVVHVYHLSFCCSPLWIFASETLYLLVTLQLFIFSMWLLSSSFKLAYNYAWSNLDFFLNSTMKELTVTDTDAVFSLSVLLVTFQYCTPWFDWAEPNLVFLYELKTIQCI
jgi:hypothetical protein